jgi:hypothetical protein
VTVQQAEDINTKTDEVPSTGKNEQVTPHNVASLAIYEVAEEIGYLIDLLDTMTDITDEDWVDSGRALRRMGSLTRIARDHAAGTLATVLAAEAEAR